MGRYCRICGTTRSNESFSGKGHKICVCKNCQKLPKEEINFFRAQEELLGFWDQSNISKLNLKRLEKLKLFPSEEIQKLAHLTLDVAKVKPHKRRRMKWLKKNRRELFDRVRAYFREDYDEEEGEVVSHEFMCDDNEDYSEAFPPYVLS